VVYQHLYMIQRLRSIFCKTHFNNLSCFDLKFLMSVSKHLKSSFLITSILLSGWVATYASANSTRGNQIQNPPVKCEEIDVKLEVKHTSGNLRNGEITLDFKKSSASYTCFIFSGADNDNRLELTGTKFSDLGKGDYNLYIQNRDGCTKHMKFKIN
jgi:hypothetical protein